MIGKELPVNCKGPPCRNPGRFGSLHEEGTEATKLFLQEPHGVFQRISPQGVGADQLPKTGEMVGRRIFLRLHLMERYGYPFRRGLPGGFAAGKTPADDGYFWTVTCLIDIRTLPSDI